MGALKKIEEFILPHEVDFFKRLRDQSTRTKDIIDELQKVYVAASSSTSASLRQMIHDAEDIRAKNLSELYQIFITPVDTESISRAYVNLDWVVMSIKHLVAELEIFGIQEMRDYKKILELLSEAMGYMHAGFTMLSEKDGIKSSQPIFDIVHLDNEVIKEYARHGFELVSGGDMKRIFTQKEILDQLREISKRIRMCANDLEDMLFKMR